MKQRQKPVCFDEEMLSQAVEIMRALSHTKRLYIVRYIHTHRGCRAKDIYETFGFQQSETSQHLQILRTAGIVGTEEKEDGIQNYLNLDVLARASTSVQKFISQQSIEAQ